MYRIVLLLYWNGAVGNRYVLVARTGVFECEECNKGIVPIPRGHLGNLPYFVFETSRVGVSLSVERVPPHTLCLKTAGL